uniref:Uncharacterized protein n=1 Tax=Salarias fasciatus TaxID=181472 RepID=A0A672HRM2_SALFA
MGVWGEAREGLEGDPLVLLSCFSALFAMEINVAKNMVTGESQVLSTADVAPEEIGQRVGLKVYEDETKCIYAFTAGEASAETMWTRSSCTAPARLTSRPRRHRGSAHCDRARSPLYGDDAPYTILNAVDTTEPITAIFMGFQMAVDDSGQAPGHDGALRAELVVIGDEQETREGAGPMGRQREGVEAAARRSRYQKDPEKTQTVLQCVLNGPTDTPRHDRPGLTRANQD